MRTLRCFVCSLMVLCAATVRAQDLDYEPTALLAVHFGTTYDSVRLKTIDAINDLMAHARPDLDFAEAYTSRTVIKRLAAHGEEKQTPLVALSRLLSEGYRRVVIQPTFVIDGKEMDLLRREVDQLRPFYDSIVVGRPLLYSVSDCQRVSDVLTARHPADSRRHEHVVFVGHGTEGPATALYSQMDYMLRAAGHAEYHVATIEGYPTLDTLIDQLRQQKARRVKLVPLLFVAGDHAAYDISEVWKQRLEQEGFEVSLAIEGLGEVPGIQQLYVERLRD